MTVVFIDTSEILRTHLIYRRQSITVCEMLKYSKRELVGMKGRVVDWNYDIMEFSSAFLDIGNISCCNQ